MSFWRNFIFINKMEKISLFAFDVNNLVISLKKKYDGIQLRKISPFKKIKSIFFDQIENYKAFFFTSKHFSYLKKEFPENDKNFWYIEEYRKQNNEFVDIDTALTGLVVHFIESNFKKIEHFYLGSGDKDLHIVVDTAKKYNIPVSIIVIQEKNLSKELKELADNIIILYER